MRRFLSLTWALCGLSVLSAQTPYTLKSCLETGLERNYSIRIARNEERISSSNATRAAAGALPTLDLSAGYDGALSDSRTRPRAGETSSENGAYDQTVSAGLDLEWTIFEGFRIRTDYRRLQELKAQGELETRIAIEDFVASLAAEYYNFVQQKIRLKLLYQLQGVQPVARPAHQPEPQRLPVDQLAHRLQKLRLVVGHQNRQFLVHAPASFLLM